MYELVVKTSSGEYPVRIARGMSGFLAEGHDVVLVDSVVQTEVLKSEGGNEISMIANEETKTLAGCEDVLRRMHEKGARRGSSLLAIGGGAVQDVATLVSSIYMRGIRWTYAPTTAMAMADSCIGGKSSINVAGIKNLVGNIYPPAGVLVDPSFATTLNSEAKVSGLAEAVKICFAKSPEDFDTYVDLAMEPADFGVDDRTDDLVHHVLSCKKWFIEVDEFDQKERQLLNFGHTYAHALESATGFALPHGVAVGIGVLAATYHPLAATGPNTKDLQRYCQAMLHPISPAVEAVVDSIDWEVFDRAVDADKKGTQAEVRVVLPSSAGGVELVGMPRSSHTFRLMRESMAVALGEATR